MLGFQLSLYGGPPTGAAMPNPAALTVDTSTITTDNTLHTTDEA